MSLSPLLAFAIDSFEEAVKKYLEGTEKSNKFCVMHCDHSVELILKEKLRDMRTSIYEKNGRTIDFHDAMNMLENKGVKIPERADLELIHDQRNIIQHRGATVSRNEADFSVKKTHDFIKRFLKDSLNLQLRDVLDVRYYEMFEPKTKEVVVEETIKFTDKVEVKVIPVAEFLSTVLIEYRNLEVDLRKLSDKKSRGGKFPIGGLVDIMISDGTLPKDAKQYFDLVSLIRNQLAHSDKTISENELKQFTLAIMRLRSYIEEALKK